MMHYAKLTIICLSFFLCNTASSQLMSHGDKEYAQLNLYGRYFNESNNVIKMLQQSLSDVEVQKILQDNFDITLYHMPKLTLLDRFTCELAHASIKSNVRRMDDELHQGMYNDLKELRIVEAELNDYILSKTDKLKNFGAISSDDLMPMFKKISDKQQLIVDKLNKLNSGFETPKFYNDVYVIYEKYTDYINSKAASKTESADLINELIEAFDFSPIEQWDYPKGLLVDAFDQIKSAMENDLDVHDIYKQDGIPQMLNKVLLIYKNNNKEEKFIELMNPPLRVE